ncbi:uncharacterized protein METZ01_LOCUS159648 [marine metagenome]|uniref:RanBP2-type domain-containing protein n=1 Tax=marine metagenome TaxID=408172 RepID=A0A382AZK3_9ZZZZ
MWICKQCEEKIEDSFDTCWNCGYEKTGKEIISESFEETKKETSFEKTKKETKKYLTLSYKYGILRFYQILLTIFIILTIISGIIVLINNNDLPTGWTFLIICLVFIIGIFGMYCGIKIIDFLFELDEKNDNSGSK